MTSAVVVAPHPNVVFDDVFFFFFFFFVVVDVTALAIGLRGEGRERRRW